MLAIAFPASTHAAPRQDLRSPDARDAASAASAAGTAPAQPQSRDAARQVAVVESSGSDDETLAIALASAAIAIALAGLAVALGALFRRPRRWTVS